MTLDLLLLSAVASVLVVCAAGLVIGDLQARPRRQRVRVPVRGRRSR